MGLLTRDECLHHIGFRCSIVHIDCDTMAVSCFKQALHFPEVVAQEPDIARISEVRNLEIRTNLQGYTKNPVDNVVEERRW